jgi:predicted porin
MNKKLIAAAIAAAMAAPAAYADATVYGQLKLHIDSTGGTGGESMGSHGSRLGFKGSEDLGNGMKAIFKLEFELDMDDAETSSGSPFAKSRSQYVGLSGNFGTVMFGTRETNYLLTTAKMDLFGDTMADYNKLFGFDDGSNGLGSRPNNAIHYVSPSFSGLSIAGALYGDDTELTGSGGTGGYDVAVMYNNAGIKASAAVTGTDSAADDNLRLGLGYKMDALYVGVVYEDDAGVDIWAVSGSYKMGNNTIKATFGDKDGGTDGWAVGVDHKFSKRTKVYALYADGNSLNSDNVGDASGFSFGMQHNF